MTTLAVSRRISTLTSSRPSTPEASTPEASTSEDWIPQLGGAHRFDREAAFDAALQITFDAAAEKRLTAIARLFVLPEEWANDIDVRPMPPTGPNFTKGAVNRVRAAKLKGDLKNEWTMRLEYLIEQFRNQREQAET